MGGGWWISFPDEWIKTMLIMTFRFLLFFYSTPEFVSVQLWSGMWWRPPPCWNMTKSEYLSAFIQLKRICDGSFVPINGSIVVKSNSSSAMKFLKLGTHSTLYRHSDTRQYWHLMWRWRRTPKTWQTRYTSRSSRRTLSITCLTSSWRTRMIWRRRRETSSSRSLSFPAN